jgi:dTDP-4-dehydrorhamnose 3,5-epimerase-like enzyme
MQMAKVNEDHRGLFVELSKLGTELSWAPKQVSLLTINPSFYRGHHYHKVVNEAFILIEGECRLSVFTEGKRNGLEMTMKPYEVYIVMPGEEHTLFSQKGGKLIVLSDTVFDPKNPDTFVYD